MKAKEADRDADAAGGRATNTRQLAAKVDHLRACREALRLVRERKPSCCEHGSNAGTRSTGQRVASGSRRQPNEQQSQQATRSNAPSREHGGDRIERIKREIDDRQTAEDERAKRARAIRRARQGSRLAGRQRMPTLHRQPRSHPRNELAAASKQAEAQNALTEPAFEFRQAGTSTTS